MPSKPFFSAPEDHSKVKAEVVAKYFTAWSPGDHERARTNPRVGYIDLFAGPERYEDGTTSTPILVGTRAARDTI